MFPTNCALAISETGQQGWILADDGDYHSPA